MNYKQKVQNGIFWCFLVLAALAQGVQFEKM